MEISIVNEIHETYNARYLTPQKVAETFVFTDDFEILAKPYNVIIIGHRGSGKTTLLKMLTSAALQSWNPVNQKERLIKESINYISVFIPADLLWKDQIDKIRKKLKDDEKFCDLVTDTIVKANILNAFVNCIEESLSSLDSEKRDLETEISKSLMQIWRLPSKRANTFGSLKNAISEKLNDIDVLVGKAYQFEYSHHESMQELKNIPNSDLYYINISNLLNDACTIYENFVNQGKPFKWALCFDELELVPKSLFEELISQLRNAPQRFIFKLSVAPIVDYSRESIDHQPLEGHDFTAIRLWPFGQEQISNSKEFTQNLIVSKLNNYLSNKNINNKIKISGLKNIFRHNDYYYSLKEFDFIEKNLVDRTAEVGEKYSLSWYTFRKLASQDKSFSYYLSKKHIDCENPVARTEEQKNEVFRKVKEIVNNRLIFAKLGYHDDRKYRSRKKFPLYYGTNIIYNICEGNPRWILRLLESMFKNIRIMNEEPVLFERNQVNSIMETSEQFYSLIYTFSIYYKIKGITWRLHTLIDKLGYFASREINIGEFKPNPANVFIIDTKLPEEILKLLRIAINIGALIVVDPQKPILSTDIYNEKVRLNYLLAPIFKLPLRQYNSVSMSSVLTNDQKNLLQYELI